jgi:hypothetical protein
MEGKMGWWRDGEEGCDMRGEDKIADGIAMVPKRKRITVVGAEFLHTAKIWVVWVGEIKSS